MRKVLRVLFGLLAVASILGLAACDMTLTKTTTGTQDPTVNATVFATVGGRIVGPDGKPLAGVVISSQTGASSKAVVSVTTGADGMFELTGFISGYHTIFIGNGISSTQQQIYFMVPELADLTADSTIQVMGGGEEPLPAVSTIKQYNGHYFVNIALNEGTDQFVIYPCTATISGTAMLRTKLQNQEGGTGEAIAAPAGTVIVADFADWNNGEPLLYRGTVGTAGAFTIANVPAVSSTIGTSTIDLYAVTGDELEGEAANKSSMDSIIDGVLEPGQTRSFPDTPFYFTVGYAPRIVTFSPLPTTLDGLGVSGTDTGATFSPGTSTVPTPIVLTFDEAMDTTKGTVTVVDSASGGKTYTVDPNWNGTTTVLTITPTLMFGYGQTIKVTLTGFESAAEVAYVPPTAGLLFTVSPAFAKVSDNMTFSTTGSQAFPVNRDLTATFNYDIGFIDQAATGLYTYTGTGTGFALVTRIDATASSIGKVLTVNPTADLEPNTNYILYFLVKTSMLEGTQDLTGNSETTGIKFKTAPDNAPLTAPSPTWLALDDIAKIDAVGTTKYEFGDRVVYVTIQKVANADSYNYRYRESSSDDWIVITNPVVATTEDSTYCYATLDLSPETSGPANITVTPAATRQIQVIAVKSTDGDAILASNILDVSDTTAPTAVSTSALTGFSNTTGLPIIQTITITLPGSEPMAARAPGNFTWTGGTAPTGVSIPRVRMSEDNTAMYVDIRINDGGDAGGYTLNVMINDFAGNAYDHVTGGTQDAFPMALGS